MTTEIRQRPGVVTFIGVILWIMGIIAAITAVVAVIFRTDSDFQTRVGRVADELMGYAIVELVVAILVMVVANGIMSGTRTARTFVAVIMVIRIAVAAWWLVTDHSGGLMASGGLTILISIFVLWALYGTEKSDAYFAETPS